jgi:uncharacterized protein (DUF885 family)
MGLYEDDVARLGRWQADALRGARLVADTGLHALGWSVDRAVAYLVEQAGQTEATARAEVTRYLQLPGQALLYKFGALEIRRLRDEAERRLGARFDVRGFHDVVLGSGAVPLPTLRRAVNAWIESRAR